MQQAKVIIIGAGPIGIELAVAFKLLGVDYVHLESKQIAHTVSWYPRQVRIFSSPERIAIAGVPFTTVHQERATREQYLAYLRGVVQQFDLDIRTYEPVTSITRRAARFIVESTRQPYETENIVLAIGDMHRPRKLGIEGESLPHMHHYFDEPHQYFRKRLLIVGGRNSAVEAAIRCQRAGAQVSISYRQAAFDTDSIKYWITPEIEMLVKTGHVAFYPGTVPTKITADSVYLAPTGNCENAAAARIDADFVLMLIGYEMNTTLLEEVGVELAGKNRAPKLDLKTMQTNVPGIYVAGTAAAGTQIRFRLFIENGHPHVEKIVQSLTGQSAPFATKDKTHSGKFALPES